MFLLRSEYCPSSAIYLTSSCFFWEVNTVPARQYIYHLHVPFEKWILSQLGNIFNIFMFLLRSEHCPSSAIYLPSSCSFWEVNTVPALQYIYHPHVSFEKWILSQLGNIFTIFMFLLRSEYCPSSAIYLPSSWKFKFNRYVKNTVTIPCSKLF